jgi:hypothetical protein
MESNVMNGGCLGKLKEITKRLNQHYATSVHGMIIMTIACIILLTRTTHSSCKLSPDLRSLSLRVRCTHVTCFL